MDYVAPLAPGFWADIFGNDRPVEVEIGPGRGEFLIAAAAAQPLHNYFAIEHSHPSARSINDALARRGLANARVIPGDAPCVLTLLPDACVAAYHIQFPDPWWKRRHHRRRIWTPAFVALLARTLAPAGAIHFITDVPDYFAFAQGLLNASLELELIEAGPATDAATNFARKALSRGVGLQRSLHRRRP